LRLDKIGNLNISNVPNPVIEEVSQKPTFTLGVCKGSGSYMRNKSLRHFFFGYGLPSMPVPPHRGIT